MVLSHRSAICSGTMKPAWLRFIGLNLSQSQTRLESRPAESEAIVSISERSDRRVAMARYGMIITIVDVMFAARKEGECLDDLPRTRVLWLSR